MSPSFDFLKNEHHEAHMSKEPIPIAVVGMGFRGPGEASDLDDLWKMMEEKREAWSTVPEDRWNHEAFYHPDSNRSGTTNVSGGHFMRQDMSKFDAPFFSMTRAEAEALDPQQRLLLECSYEALENAGMPLTKVVGSETCCFVGSFCGDYTDMLSRDPDSMPFYQATSSGHSRAIIANRLSYFFDFRGPSVTIDTACSASLVALHLACQSLRMGETKQALVAGANIILSHEMTISMTMMGFLSPDGRCYSFDERANGYSRGEGVGCVFLKPLTDALRDGDPIRAIIRNTGSNQDGKTPGITLPSKQAQEDLIRSVYAKVNLDPTITSFVECHGTGTPAGDPLEAAAIANIFTSKRQSGNTLRIGSIKTNIGHLEGASGIAGLIKSILMLEKGKIIPNSNFERPSKRIPWEDWKLEVPTKIEDFPASGPRIVSVNSFGYGGTNAHAIVQDIKSFLNSTGSNGHMNGQSESNSHSHENGSSLSGQLPSRIFLLSAFDQNAVKGQAESLAKFLKEENSLDEQSFLQDLAYTLSDRRTRFSTTAAVHARSKDDLIAFLTKSTLRATKSPKNINLGFVFTGQGAQWWGMGRELFSRFPVFAQSISDAESTLLSLGAKWKLRDEMFKDADMTRVNEAQLSQPVCTALQIALVDLLSSFDIKPAAVTGHSSGEIAAAYCAGALTATDAIAAAYHRGLISEIAKHRSQVPGGMMAVSMSEEEATRLIGKLRNGIVVIACINSANSLTISGDVAGLDELKSILDERKIFARKLTVEVAYHSHHMANVAEDYLAAISHIKSTEATDKCAFYSSVTGRQAALDSLGPQYWVENMLGQVKFESALQEMCQPPPSTKKAKKRSGAKNITTLCEIGPHSALAGPVRQVLTASDQLRDKGISMLSCLIRNKNAESTVADVVCNLSEVGLPVKISTFNASASPSYRKPKVLTNLPPYRWNHDTSYWAESRISKEYRQRPYSRNDILGVPVVHFNNSEPRWRNIIKTGEMPWIKDHKVQGSVIYPAAGFMSMTLEAMGQQARQRSLDVESFELREVTIGQALVIPDDTGEVEVFFSMKPFSVSVRSPSDIWNEFTISSVSPDNRWTEHSRGLVRAVKASKANDVLTPYEPEAENLKVAKFVESVSKDATEPVSTEHFYFKLGELGLEYGPTFANVRSIRVGHNKAVSSINIADTASVMPNGFEYRCDIHPSTLDSLFHPLFAALGIGSKELQDPFVPILINQLVMSTKMRTQRGIELNTWTETKAIDDRQISASIVVFDGAGSTEEPVLQIEGLVCMKIAKDEGTSGKLEKTAFSYQTRWLADADVISSSDLASLCQDLTPDAQEEKRVEAFEEAGYYLMKQAFPQISETDVENALPHHKRLYNCMRARLAEHKGQYIADSFAIDELLGSVSASGAEGDLLVHVGKNLVPIIQKKTDALGLMVEDGRLDAYYRDNSRFDRNYKQANRYLDLAGHKNPNMSILEIGSGTGGATLPILHALTDEDTHLCRFGKYTFTDISTGFFVAAKEKLAQWSNLITYAKLDIELDPMKQGFETGAYDVIVAANVLHATRSMKNTMTNVRKLLRPGGKLILVELTRERFTTSTIFGTLSGWFAGEEANRMRGPTLTEEMWDNLLQETGFSGLDAAVSDARSEAHHQGSMMIATASSAEHLTAEAPKPEFLIICEEEAPGLILVEHISGWLQSLGATVSTTSLETCEPEGKICIVLSELSESVFRHPKVTQFESIQAIFTTASAVLWVTKGAQVKPSDPTANMVTGFARTVKSEYGNSTIITLDLDPTTKAVEIDKSTKAIETLVSRHLLESLLTKSLLPQESEYVERAGKLLIPRLVTNKSLDRSMKALLYQSISDLVPFEQPERPLVVEVGTAGLLDTIRFVDDLRIEAELPADMVEISVKASGFNFKDVMMAMGQIAVETLGGECSGVVRRTGANVSKLQVGDRVACYAFGTFSNLVRQDAAAVQKIPDDMSFKFGAALPVTFCTAYYSVVNVARIHRGQSVLIHAASGGLGQALIELCKICGADIFCTVGTLEKKKLLMNDYSIPEDHIFTSRDTSFASMIMQKTCGRGVDVIMNSVAGEMLRVTWDCIAPFGTFVELGARDYTINSRLEMSKFARNVTFTAVNLVSLIRERPEIAAGVWADVMDLFRKKELRGPTPLTAYSMSEIEPVLRLMQSGKHLGKLVAVVNDEDVVKAASQISPKTLFKSNASYLLVGGVSGLGGAIALWMLKNQARNFIFASRSGLDRPEARDLKTILEASGANVVFEKCDVSKKADLENLMNSASHLPPVKGVIQGAMVLQDALLSNMHISEYEAVVQPKVEGTWNLHQVFEKDSLDFFVMLSSTSGVIGNASQAAYAASSTFLDSFALYRYSQGLAASTLDLGVITGIGYVARNQELARALERQAFEGTNEEHLMALLHSAILAGSPSNSDSTAEALAQSHIVTGLGTWSEDGLGAFDRPLFSHFRRAGQMKAGDDAAGGKQNGANVLRVREALKLCKKLNEAAKIVCDRLVAKISSLSMIPVEDISTDSPMSEYGMDSLVAVEMRNWIDREIGAAVPILELMANEPLHRLANKVLLRSRLVDISTLEA